MGKMVCQISDVDFLLLQISNYTSAFIKRKVKVLTWLLNG